MTWFPRYTTILACVLALAGCQTVTASAETPFRAVSGYGAAAQVPGASLRPDARSARRAVFPATRAAATPGAVIPALEKAARYVNLLSQEGIRITPGDVVVVVSGPATAAILNDEAYRARVPAAPSNPNLAIIRALRESGVVVSVCGQALHGQRISVSDVAPGVRLDLSAMTSLVHLQSQGYALIPE